jgi:hypothetical protein
MSPHTYLPLVVIGAAGIGAWLSVRFASLTPRRGLTAAACFAVAWLATSAAPPLASAATGRLPVGPAILVAVFPVFVATFALIAFGLRYYVELVGGAAR